MPRLRLKLIGESQPREVFVEREGEAFRYRTAERSGLVEIERISDTGGWIRLDGAVIPFHAIPRNGLMDVWIAGTLCRVEIIDAARRSGAGSERKGRRSDRVTAPMPGSVRQILVSRGDAVRPHQPIVIMESMKMELTLSVPDAGRVRDVLCREGQLVEMGALLVQLEATD